MASQIMQLFPSQDSGLFEEHPAVRLPTCAFHLSLLAVVQSQHLITLE